MLLLQLCYQLDIPSLKHPLLPPPGSLPEPRSSSQPLPTPVSSQARSRLPEVKCRGRGDPITHRCQLSRVPPEGSPCSCCTARREWQGSARQEVAASEGHDQATNTSTGALPSPPAGEGHALPFNRRGTGRGTGPHRSLLTHPLWE